MIDLPGGTQVVVNDSLPVPLKVAAEGLTMTVTDIERDRPRTERDLRAADRRPRRHARRRRRPAVSVDGKPVAPTHDTGGSGGGQKPPENEVVVTPPPDSPVLTASLRGGRVKLSKAGVALIAVQVSGGGATGTVTLTAKLGRRTVRIGSARVTLPAGRTVKAKVKVSKAARRAVGRARAARRRDAVGARRGPGKRGRAPPALTATS